MTLEQQTWFLNGYGWTLGMLKDAGHEIDEVKLLKHLNELSEGSFSSVDSPEEAVRRIPDIVANLELDDEAAAALREEFEQMVRRNNPLQRRIIAEADKEASRLILASRTGMWPPMPDA